MTARPAAAPHLMTRAEVEALPRAFPAKLVKPRNKTFRAMYESWSSNNPAEIGDTISWVLRLEHVTIPVTVKECGRPRAFYSPRDKTIHICYEFMAYVNELAKRPRGTVDPLVNNMMMFSTLHEIGHAVIDVLKLRIDWNEEDAADQFALLAMTGGEDDELARAVILAPAAFFKRHGSEVTEEERDDHSHGAKRSIEALCILYGRHRDARAKKALGERAQACIEYTDTVVARWNRLLAPYTRISSGNTF